MIVVHATSLDVDIQRMMIVHHYTPRLQRGLPVGLSVVVGEWDGGCYPGGIGGRGPSRWFVTV